MALFPKCGFKVLVPDGLIIPGTRIDGELVVTAPEEIPRAEHVDLCFRSYAWAGYGSGKNRSVVRRELFMAPLHVDLPKGTPFAAGEHRYPFAINVPSWLPPGYQGNDAAIEHVIETRLDVDWAVDPVAKLIPFISMNAREARRTSLTTRSPVGFHDEIVLEVTLASSVIAIGEPITGQIALRSGHQAKFEAVTLTLESRDTVTMGRGDVRAMPLFRALYPANSLRSGDAVTFEFPKTTSLVPTFRTAFIDHDLVLKVSVNLAWRADPSFALKLDVLPKGSLIEGETTTTILGGERIRRLAAAMARATGLREGAPPHLVSGNIGALTLSVVDSPREAKLGIDVDITFPDVELGISCRPLGLLEGFRTSPLLPKALGDRFLLRCKPTDARPETREMALAAFFEVLLGGVAGADDIRLSDHHLGVHIPLGDDGERRMIEVARVAQAQAKLIGDAISALPFPLALAASRPAWQATAGEQTAFLVPTGPSLHGLSFRARVIGGEERVMGATIRTMWNTTTPTTRVEIDLRDVPIPEAAWSQLEGASTNEAVRAVRAVFPIAHVTADGKGATLDHPAFAADPRSLLSAIETFLWWVLDTRSERRADLPYR